MRVPNQSLNLSGFCHKGVVSMKLCFVRFIVVLSLAVHSGCNKKQPPAGGHTDNEAKQHPESDGQGTKGKELKASDSIKGPAKPSDEQLIERLVSTVAERESLRSAFRVPLKVDEYTLKKEAIDWLAFNKEAAFDQRLALGIVTEHYQFLKSSHDEEIKHIRELRKFKDSIEAVDCQIAQRLWAGVEHPEYPKNFLTAFAADLRTTKGSMTYIAGNYDETLKSSPDFAKYVVEVMGILKELTTPEVLAARKKVRETIRATLTSNPELMKALMEHRMMLSEIEDSHKGINSAIQAVKDGRN